MIRNNIFLLILYIVSTYLKFINADCVFQYKRDFHSDKPVVLFKDDNSLFSPAIDSVRINVNKNVQVACPGAKNYIKTFETPLVKNPPVLVKAKCNRNSKLEINGKEYLLKELNCEEKAMPQCKDNGVSCGNTNRASLIDVTYTIANTVDNLYKICFDKTNKAALYVQQQMYGATIELRGSSNRPTFKGNCLPSEIPQETFNKAYITAQQNAYCKNEFGIEYCSKLERLKKPYAKPVNIKTKKHYLAKGHLIAYADQVSTTSQFATCLYMNTVPMWQDVNNGNWKKLEDSIRRYADRTKENLMILAGGYGHLQLPDLQKNPKDVYLDENKQIVVPKYLWKLVYSTKNGRGIGFITFNNPFDPNINLGSLPSSLSGCQQCQSYKWGTTQWANYEKGALFCCTIQQLASFISQIPNTYSNNNGILNGPD